MRKKSLFFGLTIYLFIVLFNSSHSFSQDIGNWIISSDTPINIPDNDQTGNGVNSSIEIGSSFNIRDVNIRLNVTHGDLGDLKLSLNHDGNLVSLIFLRGDGSVNFINTVLDDEAEKSLSWIDEFWFFDGFTYSFRPEESLNTFDDTDANGTWTLNVIDIREPDVGVLESWEIYFETDSDDTDITSFSFTEQIGAATIDESNHTVDIEVEYETDVTSLIPSIGLSAGATVSPNNGIAQDFTNSVTYTVTAEDGVTTQDWAVTVTIEAPSNETDITSFSIPEQRIVEVVDPTNHTVHIEVEYETDVTSLIPSIGLSAGATVSPNSGISQNFTSPVTYSVTAEDGTTSQDWEVTVRIFQPPPTISSFSPMSGPVGTEVTIVGTKFDANSANNIVFFGATKAVVSNATETELKVSVPDGVTFMPITVLANGLVAYSSKPFVATFIGSRIDINSFDPKSDISTGSGSHPSAVSIGDFDGDGKPDLVVTNRDYDNLSVYRNISSVGGIISYDTKVDCSTGDDPISVSIGDIDNDGKPDLVVANFNVTTVSVLRNTSSGLGNINFANKVDFTAGSKPLSISLADFNVDGRADLAVVNQASNNVSVLINHSKGIGDVNFAVSVDFETGPTPYSVSTSDIDADGKTDIVVANSGNKSVSVFRNTTNMGSISFADKEDFTVNSGPVSVSIGDLDNDGKPDIATGNWDSKTVSILRNTSISSGNISFANNVDFTTGNDPGLLSIGDLNGDTKLDIVVVNNGGGSLSVFENTSLSSGTISYATRVDFATGSNTDGISIGDLNNDGKPDLVATNYTSNTVSIIRNIMSPSSETEFSSFLFPEQTNPAIINTTNFTIDIEVAYETTASSLVSTFSLLYGASAKVGSTPQVSGTTVNDFTGPVTYTIMAADGVTTQDWDVKVTVALPSIETDIMSFSMDEQTSRATLDAVNHTIDIEVIYGTDLTSLIPLITTSDGADVSPGDQVAQDYSDPVTYTVTAEDGITTQDWIATVAISSNTETDILSFSFDEQSGAASIDAVNHIIDIEMVYGTNLTSLVPTIIISDGATVSPEDQVVQDFSNPAFPYTVTAEDGISFQEWMVNVAIEPNNETDILSFSMTEQTGVAVIDEIKHTIDLEVSYGTDLTSLIPTIALSPGAAVSPSNQVAHNFTNQVTYAVTAEDGITVQDWLVTVTVSTVLAIETHSETVSIFPNPSKDYILISDVKEEVIESVLTNMEGKSSSIALEKDGRNLKGDISNLPNGLYTLRIYVDNRVYQAKIIKQ